MSDDISETNNNATSSSAASSSSKLQTDVRDQVVLDLKRQALACKQADNKAEALQFLKQSKEVAAAESIEDLPSIDLQCLYLKSLASHLQSSGDTEGEMAALKRAKQLKGETDEAEDDDNDNDDDDGSDLKELQDEDGSVENQAAAAVSFTDEEMMDEDMMTELQMGGMDIPSEEIYQQRVLATKKKALALKKQGDVSGATLELRKAKQLEKVMGALVKNDDGASSAQQEETSFVLDGENAADRWMESLTPEESELLSEIIQPPATGSDGDDVAILLDDNDAEEEKNVVQSMEWQELEDLDDSDIREFLDMGIVKLPPVSDLNELAEEAQKQAIAFKQKGNIEMAKAKLLESKKIRNQAGRLERILAEESGGGGEQPDGDTIEDLEKLLVEGDTVAPKPAVPKKQKPSNPWFDRPSAEIKAEVFRLKDAKKVQDASQLLLIYKQVLQKENEAKEAARCAELISKIKLELDLCRQQQLLYTFYKAFVDENVGAEQLLLWSNYDRLCRQAIAIFESKGSAVLSLGHPKEPKLQIIQGGNNDDGDVQQLISRMIEEATIPNSLNGRLEVRVLEVLNLSENKSIQKLLKKRQKEQVGNKKTPKDDNTTMDKSLCRQIQVDLKIQLPPEELDSSNKGAETPTPQSTGFTLLPTNKDAPSDESETAAKDQDQTVDFSNSPCSVKLPRGDSYKEKALLRRLERKKVEFHVVYNPNIDISPAKETSSWFWKSPPKKETKVQQPTTNLGKIVVELKDLLSRNCIAGEFPLVVNTKIVGGSIRLCVRTDSPLDADQYEADSLNTTKLALYSRQLLFSRSATPASK
eukprot:scaffold1429_cov110-Cylindrotheca_fusiformis.AAC.8